jgi:hypothetical protein
MQRTARGLGGWEHPLGPSLSYAGRPPHAVPSWAKLRFDSAVVCPAPDSSTEPDSPPTVCTHWFICRGVRPCSDAVSSLRSRSKKDQLRNRSACENKPITCQWAMSAKLFSKEQAWPTRLPTSPNGSRRPGCNHPRRKAASVQAGLVISRMPSRSCTTATNPLLSSQRSPSAICLRSFLAWPTGSFRARLKASAACRLIGDSTVSSCC